MSGFDRFKLPEGRRPFRGAMMMIAVLLAAMVSLAWWSAAPLWRLPVVVALGAAAGHGLALALMRDARRATEGGPTPRRGGGRRGRGPAREGEEL